MNISESTKPVIWGAVGGAIAAMVIGFSWGGWITGGAAANMQKAVAQKAVVQAFTPLCVVKAELQPEQISLMQEMSRYKRDDFVIEAGWIDNVSKQYRSGVADACADTIIEGTG